MNEEKVNTNPGIVSRVDVKKVTVCDGGPKPRAVDIARGEVDVAQLLHDIGEASACTNPLELLRLCLGAQSVLAQVHDGGTVTQNESALFSHFRAMDDDAQDYLLKIAGGQAKRHPRRQRPALALVQVGRTGGAA